MALTLNFTFGTPCSGGNHVPLTATLSGALAKTRTITTSREQLLSTPDDDTIAGAMEVIVRLLIFQLSNKTNANIKSVIEAKNINLTVNG